MLFIYDILFDVIETSIKKVDVYSSLYKKYKDDCNKKEKELQEVYKGFCLKNVKKSILPNTIKKSFDAIKEYSITPLNELLENNSEQLCILEKNHQGKCISNSKVLKKLFSDNSINDLINDFTNFDIKDRDKTYSYEKIIKTLENKIEFSVFSTPGSDDCIYKNRANRLFPLVLSKTQERKIRIKDNKLKCAIPLSEHATPFGIASACIDLITFILSIKDIENYLINNSNLFREYMNHKIVLQNYWQKYNIKVFDNYGYLTKPLKNVNELISIKNFSVDKFDRKDSDIEMGHGTPRTEGILNIRGLNLLFMTRRENLILGDNDVRENSWREDLKNYI